MISKIISGGQTGADQGGLAAAKELGIPTGGWMTKDWRTETGPRPEFEELYSMTSTLNTSYPFRTSINIQNSCGTIIFGKLTEPGTKLTRKLCEQLNFPYLSIPYPFPENNSHLLRGLFFHWLKSHTPFDNWEFILNVAGNRESVNPGIFKFTKQFLIESLKQC